MVDCSQLHLDQPLDLAQNSRVLVSEPDDLDPDDTPDEIVLAGLHQGWREAIAEPTILLAQMRAGMDAQ
ncbi:MAG: hypothetical protein HC910_22495 [Spirulinaceae cyanobacterium SM2_1_0]|nr:hypothetical protein [Spirulinaceae cyanobacterium SM2_1_0]